MAKGAFRVSEGSGSTVAVAIKHLLMWKLRATVDVAMTTGEELNMDAEKVHFFSIPLHLVKQEIPLLYICAIAFKLAPVWAKPAMEIATQIAADLSALGNTCPSKVAQAPLEAALADFIVTVEPPGWLHLRFSDLAIAAWLQRLAQIPPWLEAETKVAPYQRPRPATASLFEVQYSHARCCSLLRLAHREGLILLQEPDPEISPEFWKAIAPNPLPWLDAQQQLRLTHPAERSLIFHLLALLDDLYCPSPSHPPNWEKSIRGLSQIFQTFYRDCRIWGEVKTLNPELAQARLGLIMATQSILRLLLQDCLGVPAPLEL